MEESSSIQTPVLNKETILPVLALLAAVVFWGSAFVGMRFALKTLDPQVIIFVRMITAFFAILPFAGKLIPREYKSGDWKILSLMVIFQPCLYFLLESNALRFTTSTQAGVVSALVPLLVGLGAWLFLSEKITKITITGLFLSVAGVVLLTMSQGSDSQASNPVLGNSMEALAMVFAAANMLIIKKLSGRYNPWTLTAMQIVAGVLFFSPGLFKMIQMDSSLWTPGLITLLIYMGVCVSLGAFGLYNWGMSKITASKASTYINLIPVMAIVSGWLILGETLNFRQGLAAGVVIIGVLLSQKSSKS